MNESETFLWTEFEGKTLEDAKDKALDQFGLVDEDDLQFEIIEEGEKRNLLFQKGTFIRIRARSLNANVSYTDLLDFFKNLCQLSGIAEEVELHEEDSHLHVDIMGLQSDSLQSGKEILDSLQHVGSRFLIRRGKPKKLIVDSQGLRQKRIEELDEMVNQIHHYVSQGKTTTTHPLTPSERRHLHVALDNLGGVRTMSLGRGPKKRIRVSPYQQRGRHSQYRSSNY